MADLAACYFCGAALDDSVSSVSLGDGPDAPTLTLCAGCKEKLETVLAAVDREPDSGSGPDPADSVGPTDTDSESVGSTDASPTESNAPSGADPSDEPTAPSAESPGRHVPAAAGSDDANDDDGGNHVNAAGGETDVADADGSSDADAAEGGNDEGAADEGGRSIVEGDQEISALEYNKVMRLLQNREFPVDREEIVTVAANAYQVARADCDRVIEAAIDRGILEETDGQLVKPD